MPSLSELTQQVLAGYETFDLDGTIASLLHENFSFQRFPTSLTIGTKSKEEYIAWMTSYKAIIAELKVVLTHVTKICIADSHLVRSPVHG
jgi:hypothetical protein